MIYGWTLITLAVYLASRALYRRWRIGVFAPLTLAPLLLILLLLLAGTPYADYRAGAGWLLLLLGPATVAFAVPIHRQRRLIRRHWRTLLITIPAGSVLSVVSGWGMASLLEIEGATRISLAARSVTTPFAMPIAAMTGGVAELAAVFVILTGVIGGLISPLILGRLTKHQPFAAGLSLGLAAHTVGTTRGFELSPAIGAVAAVTMSLTGVVNVLAAGLWLLVMAP